MIRGVFCDWFELLAACGGLWKVVSLEDPLKNLDGLASSLERLRRLVENDHQLRLEKIDRDLKWVIFLLGAQVVGLIGAVVGRIVPV